VRKRRGRRSKVESSPNRDLYIKLRLEGGLSYTDLSREAKKRGENISYAAFSRFFRKYYRPELEKMLEAKTRELPGLQEQVVIIDEIKRNLVSLQTVASHLETADLSDPNVVRAYTSLLREIRANLEYLDRKRKEAVASLERVEETGIRRLLEILDKLPKKCLVCGTPLNLITLIESLVEQGES